NDGLQSRASREPAAGGSLRMNGGQGTAQDGGVLGSGPVAQVTIPATRRSASSRVFRILLAPVKLFWGMAFCQGLAGSILVVGWTYRLAQRSALKFWWARSGERRGAFQDFLAGDRATRVHQGWPNWFWRQDARDTLKRPEGMSLARFSGRI